MEDLVKDINALYEEALKSGLVKNQTQFAQLVRKDRATVSAALNGLRVTSHLVDEAREVLKDKGIITEWDDVSIADNATDSPVQVGDNNTNGVDPKKFAHESEWFALVAEKDKQISRLLGIIEKMEEKR